MVIRPADHGIFASQAAPFDPYKANVLGGYYYTNTIGGIDFATDTFTALGTTLATASRALGGASNNGTAGYTFGGKDSSEAVIDEIDKMPFDTQTNALLGTALSTANQYPATLANSPTSAYLGGGSDGSNFLSTVLVFTFASDTFASAATSLSSARYDGGGASNNGTAGYWMGGSGSSVIDKTTFTNGTLATLDATLSSSMTHTTAASNSGTAAYRFGGLNPKDTMDKLTYATETIGTTTFAALPRYGDTAASNSGTAAYFFGGYNASSAPQSTILKCPYATDTLANLSGVSMDRVRVYLAAYANCENL
jgi:hypothetical protein